MHGNIMYYFEPNLTFQATLLLASTHNDWQRSFLLDLFLIVVKFYRQITWRHYYYDQLTDHFTELFHASSIYRSSEPWLSENQEREENEEEPPLPGSEILSPIHDLHLLILMSSSI